MTESAQPQEIDIHSIFNKKDVPVEPHVEEEETIERPSKNKESAKKIEKETLPDDEDDEDEVDVADAKKELKPKEKAIDYKVENEKLQKTLKDTQKSFHEDRRKLSAYKKAVEKMKQEGVLLDEEATILLSYDQYYLHQKVFLSLRAHDRNLGTSPLIYCTSCLFCQVLF